MPPIHPPAPSFGILPPRRRQPHGSPVGSSQTTWNGFGGSDRPWQLVRGRRISKESRPNGDQVDPWHRGLRCSTSVRKRSNPEIHTTATTWCFSPELDEGWSNLVKLSSKAFTEGFYGVARMDKELLGTWRGGLIAINGHLGSSLASLALRYHQSGIFRLGCVGGRSQVAR